jgi:F0F1-type ATP synthase assembly protein I
MDNIFQTLFQGPQPWGMIITVVLIGCLTGVIGAVIKELGKYACHRKDVELKRDLAERGLSVEEIERVVRAGASTSGDDDA